MHQHAAGDFETRVRDSFARQGLMTTLGANLIHIAPGEVHIEMPVTPSISQQHGFVHAGAVAAIADSSCGYAAATVAPPDAGVLAVEFKINLMAPSAGDKIIARGRVLRTGRTLHVCQSDVVAVTGDQEKSVALLTATIMIVQGRPGVQG